MKLLRVVILILFSAVSIPHSAFAKVLLEEDDLKFLKEKSEALKNGVIAQVALPNMISARKHQEGEGEEKIVFLNFGKNQSGEKKEADSNGPSKEGNAQKMDTGVVKVVGENKKNNENQAQDEGSQKEKNEQAQAEEEPGDGELPEDPDQFNYGARSYGVVDGDMQADLMADSLLMPGEFDGSPDPNNPFQDDFVLTPGAEGSPLDQTLANPDNEIPDLGSPMGAETDPTIAPPDFPKVEIPTETASSEPSSSPSSDFPTVTIPE